MKWIASAAFGMEGLTGRDLKRIEAQNVNVLSIGGAVFEGGFDTAMRANLWLRTADHVHLVLDEFEARSFEELFQGIRRIPWADYLSRENAFNIRAHCVRSTLMSPSDCQKISKKAIADVLCAHYKLCRMPETGFAVQIDVNIRSDRAVVSLDASGEPLSRRGYRTWNGEAPLRETLAAALVLTSAWHPWQPLYDPCCGTGTLLIEAAFIALNRAPGLRRAFAMEDWGFVDKRMLDEERRRAQSRYDECYTRRIDIAGSDIDPEAIELAKRHVRQAGLGDRIVLNVADLRDVALTGEPGMLIANPPYGERLGDKHVSHAVGRQLGELKKRCPDWSMGVFTADMGFEREFGARADRRRRFYNGRIECEFHLFDAGNVPGEHRNGHRGER